MPGILKRLDEEKREWDRESGRRAHNFFLPNGSKILVGSYTNLRRTGGLHLRVQQHGEGLLGADGGHWGGGAALRACRLRGD